jgi:hypothetical protein
MPIVRIDQIVWDDFNVEHIAEHGVTPEEVEEVLTGGNLTIRSKRERYYRTFGWTVSGLHIVVIWDELEYNPRIAYPVTAYPVEPSARGPT